MNKSIIQNGEENNNNEERLQVGKVVEEEEEERQKWSNPIEFLLSCIAMSVRLLTTGLDTHVEAHFQRRSGLATFGASRTLLMRTVAALF